MRKIKFNVILKHEIDGNFRYEYFDYFEVFNGDASAEISRLNGKNYKVIAHREYTGLKDKHSKEIHDGDIVYVTPYGTDIYKGQKFVVYYSEARARFMFKSEGKRPVDFANIDSDGVAEFEVIGNIYENLELIKEDEN